MAVRAVNDGNWPPTHDASLSSTEHHALHLQVTNEADTGTVDAEPLTANKFSTAAGHGTL